MSPPPSPVAPLDIELSAVADSVGTARHAVAAFCVGYALDHEGIAIAVSEAVANAVTHAYDDGVDGAVRVFADLEVAALLIVISDDGRGMTPRTASAGMGVGLVIIGRVATSLQIDDDSTGTRLTMRFARGLRDDVPATRMPVSHD
jgi:anti-sigma regulatory factor (Ser/Thr protein kinase)